MFISYCSIRAHANTKWFVFDPLYEGNIISRNKDDRNVCEDMRQKRTLRCARNARCGGASDSSCVGTATMHYLYLS